VKNRKIAIALLAVVAAFAADAFAQVKAEDQIKLRKSAYALVGYNFASLNAMSQEKKPYNKDEAIRNADFVALLATVPKGFFGEGTDKGETKAKPEIWTKREDFDSKMNKMIEETGKLKIVANNGDFAALKKQVADTGSACKACHDDYRMKQN
jgi:cytochrome c556